jgi:hypothetical protein
MHDERPGQRSCQKDVRGGGSKDRTEGPAHQMAAVYGTSVVDPVREERVRRLSPPRSASHDGAEGGL